MPLEESLLQQAEDWKKQGNDAFQKSETAAAIKAYSQGLVAADRLTPPPVALKTALWSNRAACYLKVLDLQPCIDDCTSALELLENTSTEEPKLRSKLMFRRAKASFLKANMPGQTKVNDLLQGAAKDLLTLLSFDSKNKEAATLLQSIRAQHAMVKKANSPVSKTFDDIKEMEDNEADRVHKMKVMVGLLDNDTSSASMELGRLGGVMYLMGLAQETNRSDQVRTMVLQCLSAAATHPPFVRAYCKEIQNSLSKIIQTDNYSDVVVGALSVFAKCLLHLDRDDLDKPIEPKSAVDSKSLLDACLAVLEAAGEDNADTAIRGVMENLAIWSCGNERNFIIRTKIAGDVTNTGLIDGIPAPVSKAEINLMTPKELAAHRKREWDIRVRDEKLAKQRAKSFCDRGGLQNLLSCAVRVRDHFLRREITVVIGKILGAFVENDKIQKLVKPYLTGDEDKNADEKDGKLTIEEVYNEDEEERKEEKQADEEVVDSLQSMMERAELATALLLSAKEVGAWAMTHGWMDSEKEIEIMAQSDDDRCLALASEVLSAATTVPESRNIVSGLLDSGAMDKLLAHKDRDVKSGAAAAVAKLGLAGKDREKADEGEVIGLLQQAAELLEDESEQADKSPSKKMDASDDRFSGTTSLERGVEMVTYLISQTQVKEEIAAGFKASPESNHSLLQSLVKIAEMPKAGESLSGYGLATIFQHIAVTPKTIKREYFADKELNADEYDELQKLAKTEEEKQKLRGINDDDTDEMCADRIRAMAAANVPRALVQLIDGASDPTMEQIMTALNRMASEQSVRGTMIQQGALTASIKVEKEKNPAKIMKKVIQLSRHCIAKMLVTTNPSLLTSAQSMGAIKPLIQLCRDVDATQFQQFEALMAITNIAAAEDDKKNKIVAEKGISSIHFLMFSDHHMVRRAATEALCNLVGNKNFMDHLAATENLRLWLAFSADYEEHFECARAAAGCLAMATQDPRIASALIELPFFHKYNDEIIQCGSLELMHRVLTMMLNLVVHGGECKEAVIKAGFAAFCLRYVDNYHDGRKAEDLGFPEEEKHIMPITVDLAKQIVKLTEV